jgi:hypothetical protein
MPPSGRVDDFSGRRDTIQCVTDAARELGDLRAWLTVALRLAHREPGSEGLPILTVPSDHELIDEVRRLRRLDDEVDSEKPPAG